MKVVEAGTSGMVSGVSDEVLQALADVWPPDCIVVREGFPRWTTCFQPPYAEVPAHAMLKLIFHVAKNAGGFTASAVSEQAQWVLSLPPYELAEAVKEAEGWRVWD